MDVYLLVSGGRGGGGESRMDGLPVIMTVVGFVVHVEPELLYSCNIRTICNDRYFKTYTIIITTPPHHQSLTVSGN